MSLQRILIYIYVLLCVLDKDQSISQHSVLSVSVCRTDLMVLDLITGFLCLSVLRFDFISFRF